MVPPALTLPPPPFPTRFNSDLSPIDEPPRLPSNAWPTDDLNNEGADSRGLSATTEEQEGGVVVGQPRPIRWGLKTEQEQYIEQLEAKLRRLDKGAGIGGHPNGTTSSFGTDSGYGSHPTEPFEEALVEDGLDAGEDEEEDEAHEGRGLLWESAKSGMEREEMHVEDTPGTSPSKGVVVIPATPSNGETDETDDDDDEREDSETEEEEEEEDGQEMLGYGRPPAGADDSKEARRISFSASVRISGGIRRKSSKPHRHHNAPPPFTDLFIPINGDSTAPSTPFLSESLPRNASWSLSSSRGNSPSRPSSSQGVAPPQARSASTSSLFVLQQASANHSVYSSSVPSRSSSPCSSIYAPLSAPSKTCPSPMFIRAPRRKASFSDSTTNGRPSFKEYLRGRRLSNEGGESEEEVVRGYRELVEQQRRKKERWEKRRKREEEGPGFWGRVVELLAMGASGGGGATGGRNGYGAMGATTTRNGRGRKVRRTASSLSISSVSDADEVPETSTATRVVKSEEDVRFGTAPGRCISLDWWMWRIKIAVEACRDQLRSWRMSWIGTEGRAREEGYQAV